jgi:hypothetical protein
MFKRFKPIWIRRAEREEELRREATARADAVEKDWVPLKRTRESIVREMVQNDWVATAKKVFGGS